MLNNLGSNSTDNITIHIKIRLPQITWACSCCIQWRPESPFREGNQSLSKQFSERGSKFSPYPLRCRWINQRKNHTPQTTIAWNTKHERVPKRRKTKNMSEHQLTRKYFEKDILHAGLHWTASGDCKKFRPGGGGLIHFGHFWTPTNFLPLVSSVYELNGWEFASTSFLWIFVRRISAKNAKSSTWVLEIPPVSFNLGYTGMLGGVLSKSCLA